MKQQIIIPSGKYKVLCRCFTYNQSQYIVDTLKGFIMQQTNFPFVCMVVDDCSTDGEQDVIKSFLSEECDMTNAEYYENDLANIIYVNHISNQNCVMAVYLLKENLYLQKDKKMSLVMPWRQACKYEAMCEGDDYWIDPLKLQKQFDFLESHPDYSMVFHGAEILNELELDACPMLVYKNLHTGDYSATELFESWVVPTASMLSRIESLNRTIVGSEKLIAGDIVAVESCAHNGRVYCINEKMSVYRMQNNGVTWRTDRIKYRILNAPAHYETLKINFPLIKKTVIDEKIVCGYLLCIKKYGNLPQKIKWLVCAIRTSPFSFVKILYKNTKRML